MTKYRRILLALDLSTNSEHLIEQAVQIVTDYDAELLLVHVNEPVVTAARGAATIGWTSQLVSLDERVRQAAEERMEALASRLGVPGDNCFLPFGKASAEIKRVAEEQDIDLIVLGAHDRHGLDYLLGSTSSGVLHGASCDILAVRTPP